MASLSWRISPRTSTVIFVSNLAGQVAGHGVDGVGQIFPRASDAGDEGLTSKFAVGTNLAGDARDLGGENAELLNHGVDDICRA